MIKNIVYVYDHAYLSGGAAKIVIGEALEMKKRGFRVIYFSAVGPVDTELTEAGIETICLNEKDIVFAKNPLAMMKGLYNYNAYRQLKKLLKSLPAEESVVHIHGWTKALSSSVFQACYECSFRTFVTLHEYFTICPNGGLYNYQTNKICTRKPGSLSCILCNCDKRNYIHKIYRNIRQCIQTMVLKKTKPIPLYITEFSKDLIKPYFPYRSEQHMLTNHVEISKEEERIQVECNEDYLFVGRLSEEKGIDLFCDAVTRLQKKACVIGNGPLLDFFKNKYPNINFIGWKTFSEMKAYIHKARCLIISSKWYETMGLTVVEMQQFGIPCIVPAQCAASEYVIDNETGFLYRSGDVESLMETIRLTENDDLMQGVSKNFFSSLNPDRFSLKNHCEVLLKIYQEEMTR